MVDLHSKKINEKIKEILSEFYSHSFKNLRIFFPYVTTEFLATAIRELTYNQEVIYIPETNKYSIYDKTIESIVFTNENKEYKNMQKVLKILYMLLQNKDKDGKMKYYYNFKYLMRCNCDDYNYILIQKKNTTTKLFLYLMFVPANEINNFNIIVNEQDKRKGITEDDVQRIVITDSKDIDVDKINVAGVVNVISVSDDGAIEFLK